LIAARSVTAVFPAKFPAYTVRVHDPYLLNFPICREAMPAAVTRYGAVCVRLGVLMMERYLPHILASMFRSFRRGSAKESSTSVSAVAVVVITLGSTVPPQSDIEARARPVRALLPTAAPEIARGSVSAARPSWRFSSELTATRSRRLASAMARFALDGSLAWFARRSCLCAVHRERSWSTCSLSAL